MAFKDALIAASPVLLGMGQQLSGRNPAGISSGLAMMNAEQEKAKRKAAIDGLIGSMGLSQQKADFLSMLPFEQASPIIWDLMNPKPVGGGGGAAAAKAQADIDAWNQLQTALAGGGAQPAAAGGGYSMGVPDELGSPVAASGGLSLGVPAMESPAPATTPGLSFGNIQPSAPKTPEQASLYENARNRLNTLYSMPPPPPGTSQAKSYKAMIDHYEGMVKAFAPPASPTSESAEAKIARLLETKNPITGRPFTRQEAIVASEYFDMTDSGDIINKLSGEIVSRPEPTLANEAGVGTATPPGQRLLFPSSVPQANYGGAFGASGAIANVANTIADAIPGMPIPAPEINRARTALTNTALRTVTTLQESFPGRASVQLMQKLEEVAARPGRIFEGDESSIDTMEQTAGMIEGLIKQEQRKIDNPRGYTPAMRAEARAKIDQLVPLLADYQEILRQTRGGPGEGTTSSGIKYRIVE